MPTLAGSTCASRWTCTAPFMTLIWLALSSDAGLVQLSYEDKSPPYNPYAVSREAHGTVQARTVGGLGVLLTHELAEARDYTYLFGRNRIRLRMRAAA